MRFVLNPPDDLAKLIFKSAKTEMRPVRMHVEVLLRRALNLPFPIPSGNSEETEQAAKEGEER